MNQSKTIWTGLAAAALAVAVVACGPEPFTRSVVPVPFHVEVDRGAIRPAGSSVGIVGDHPSLGATAAMPQGDPLKALRLRQTPDDQWIGAAWLPPGRPTTYVVYMLDPAAPELVGQVAADGTTEPVLDAGVVRRRVNWGAHGDPYERATVTVFATPANVSRPCITFVVTVPANTPPDDTVYMAGNDEQLGLAAGAWNPAFRALTRNEDGTYGTTLCFNPGKDLKYKYVRGAWTKVEKDEANAEIADRVLSVTETATQNDTVVKWADL